MASKMWGKVSKNSIMQAVNGRRCPLPGNSKRLPSIVTDKSYGTCTAPPVPGRSDCKKVRTDPCASACVSLNKKQDFTECPPEPRYKPRQCSDGKEEACCPERKPTCPIPARPPQPCRCVDPPIKRLKECPKPCGAPICTKTCS